MIKTYHLFYNFSLSSKDINILSFIIYEAYITVMGSITYKNKTETDQIKP